MARPSCPRTLKLAFRLAVLLIAGSLLGWFVLGEFFGDVSYFSSSGSAERDLEIAQGQARGAIIGLIGGIWLHLTLSAMERTD